MHNYAAELREEIHRQFTQITDSIKIENSKYTLDQLSQDLVKNKFATLFAQGMIYKKKKLINWDLHLKEVLADCEIIYKISKSKLYYLKYFFVKEPSNYLIVCTSRPESIFGDVALFIHPEDTRYSAHVGKKVKIPGINREIPIRSDSSISTEFGTGIMKCTPAHDSHD
ncbi:hypothetical protein PVNG_02346 [Plasmodium vivax North Korean]|uniref:valine--tRNA ligase n=1 Tax=Plasmodium vivax North Korean TaxID=1035514 RepID=A0A0J9W6L0_PLAVI|nr:hypothetical protein PVNG_02346 [Plasmodium vivax North Korean]